MAVASAAAKQPDLDRHLDLPGQIAIDARTNDPNIIRQCQQTRPTARRETPTASGQRRHRPNACFLDVRGSANQQLQRIPACISSTTGASRLGGGHAGRRPGRLASQLEQVPNYLSSWPRPARCYIRFHSLRSTPNINGLESAAAVPIVPPSMSTCHVKRPRKPLAIHPLVVAFCGRGAGAVFSRGFLSRPSQSVSRIARKESGCSNARGVAS